MAKLPLKLISISRPLSREDYSGILSLDYDEATRLVYIDNMGREPKNFPEGSLGEKQFCYNPRKRNQPSVKELVEYEEV